jgi:hypothetical protein
VNPWGWEISNAMFRIAFFFQTPYYWVGDKLSFSTGIVIRIFWRVHIEPMGLRNRRSPNFRFFFTWDGEQKAIINMTKLSFFFGHRAKKHKGLAIQNMPNMSTIYLIPLYQFKYIYILINTLFFLIGRTFKYRVNTRN